MFFLPLVVGYLKCWSWFFYIFPWTGLKSCEGVNCFHVPVLFHFTLNMACRKFGEGVARLYLRALRHTWVGTDLAISPLEMLHVMKGAVLWGMAHSSAVWAQVRYVLCHPPLFLTAYMGLSLFKLQKSELSEFLTCHLIGHKMKNHGISHTCLYF